MDLKFCFVSSDYLLLFNSVVFFSFNLVERLAKNEFIFFAGSTKQEWLTKMMKKIERGRTRTKDHREERTSKRSK
jgi:hypothetical protein